MHMKAPADADLTRLLYSRKQAAFLLSESLRTIDYKIHQGTLRIIRQGGRVKITYAELLRQATIDDNTPIVPRPQLNGTGSRDDPINSGNSPPLFTTHSQSEEIQSSPLPEGAASYLTA